ncbi:unnamed protein product [Peronospora belbahrii]|uniref:Uncharacterized protein n=1 Tax=Peronospora belbahrii TaxID=622444 RepID=A0ABN8CX27_9STRA|nr:unnamed protein product [Peronospora belbahrii]
MGTQCTNITAINGDTIDFQSSFTVEPYDSVVKSMSIVQYSFKSIALSNINSIPSKMKFTIRHDDKTVLFVAYTLNLWSQAGKSFGVSLYLETVGNVAIPSNYSKLREVTVLGIECNVFSGQNKFNVDEFIIVAKKVDRDLEIDLKPFLNMLQQWTEIRSDFLLSDVSLTTQIIGGSGRVTVNHLSISVNARNM